MRTLIVTDRDGWSYMQIAQALVKHNTDPDLHLDVIALKGNVVELLRREKDYNRILLMGHQMWDLLPWYKHFTIDSIRWLTGVHSHHAFDKDLESSPEHDVEPPAELTRLLSRFRAVNCVSQRLFDLFNDKGINLYLTQNGVDTDVFRPMAPLTTDGPLRVGVAYTPKHDRRKGVEEFIRPACEKVGAVLVEAKARSDQHVRPEDMPAWHRGLSLYCCMSSSEGASIAVLEAGASGVPVVSTRVGGSTELIRDGLDGLLVERTEESLVDALVRLQSNRALLAAMSESIRQRTVEQFSWKVTVKSWLDFLRS